MNEPSQTGALQRRTGPLLLKICWAREQKTFTFECDDSRAVVVGSAREADVRIDNESVAPVQLHFERINGRIWVVPDRCGEVRVQKTWLTRPLPIESGSVLKVAGCWLDLTVHPLESTSAGSSTSGLIRRQVWQDDPDERPLNATTAWRQPYPLDDEVTPSKPPAGFDGVGGKPSPRQTHPDARLPPARPGVTTSLTVVVGSVKATPEPVTRTPSPSRVAAVEPAPRTPARTQLLMQRPPADAGEPVDVSRKGPRPRAPARPGPWTNLVEYGGVVGEFALRRPFMTFALTVAYGLLVGASLAQVPRFLAARSALCRTPCAELSAATAR